MPNQTARRMDIEPRSAYPDWLIAELRSDHAGEVGAVEIYRGALRACRDPELRKQILRHLHTETRHLVAVERVLEARNRSLALPLWRIAGWLLGYIARRAGPETYHRTIEAVETFVDQHYEQQIRRLAAEDVNHELLPLLRLCQADEVRHRNEAAGQVKTSPGPVSRLWTSVVGTGSAMAVAAARRF